MAVQDLAAGPGDDVLARVVDRFLADHGDELVAIRRRIHAHPEPSWHEQATTALVAERLAAAGLSPRVLAGGTGLVCDVGPAGADGPTVVLRADLDALCLEDTKDVPYRSTVPGVCHACGHDVHTTSLLGAGLVLDRALAETGGGRVRLVFQPAEEALPGGATAAVAAGVLEGASAIFALHCDPGLDAGRVGVKAGCITSACDLVVVRLHGPGGHTARPHLTADLVHVAARIVTDVTAGMGRLIDVRSGVSVVWGAIHAGGAPNVIPNAAEVAGTIRCMTREAWEAVPAIVRRLLDAVVLPLGATYDLDYTRGSPPVDNDPSATRLVANAVSAALGPDAVAEAVQSVGAEDFSWYLDHVPGSFARLGVRPPGTVEAPDLHTSAFDVDERAIGVAVRTLTRVAVEALAAYRS
ncbi:MAG TPA: amidohydrolase [Acidimicrobiales bacterium]|jgi:amidohydrolase